MFVTAGSQGANTSDSMYYFILQILTTRCPQSSLGCLFAILGCIEQHIEQHIAGDREAIIKFCSQEFVHFVPL
jgi:hypothetical protein